MANTDNDSNVEDAASLLGQDSTLKYAIKAAALLDHVARVLQPATPNHQPAGGFDVDQFRDIVRDSSEPNRDYTLSYMHNQYIALGIGFYLNELNRMAELGLVSRNFDDTLYRMEEHASLLLYEWNKLESGEEFSSNCLKVAQRLDSKISERRVRELLGLSAFIMSAHESQQRQTQLPTNQSRKEQSAVPASTIGANEDLNRPRVQGREALFEDIMKQLGVRSSSNDATTQNGATL